MFSTDGCLIELVGIRNDPFLSLLEVISLRSVLSESTALPQLKVHLGGSHRWVAKPKLISDGSTVKKCIKPDEKTIAESKENTFIWRKKGKTIA